MLVDIFITTCGRSDLFFESLQSFIQNTDKTKTPYRLTIMADGDYNHLPVNSSQADFILLNNGDPQGLGPAINRALAHISALNTYFDNNKSDFICMCQDDIIYEKDWLEKLLKAYTAFSKVKKLGFATGHVAVEHPTRSEVRFGNDKILFKDWIRATQMLAPTDYWLSMMPIPRMDPETGRERARPHGGMGSSVDWWVLRNHPNSVCKTGRTNLVYPGLIKHIGASQSTWYKGNLPEDAG